MIVRSDETRRVTESQLGPSMHWVEYSDLAMLLGDPLDPHADAEHFMAVVDAVHEACACLPMRLESPIEDEAAAVRLLRAGADRFERLLGRVKGCDEWSIRVERPSESVAATQRVTDRPLETPSHVHNRGASYLEHRRRRMDADAGIDRWVSGVLATLGAKLAPLASDSRVIPSGQGSGTLVLLVRRDFDIERAFVDVASGATSECTLTGPWPAFSFVTLQA
ncbi:MAG: GvpL/GvpF family gas vesicle protein [Planctomycetota bacterium]